VALILAQSHLILPKDILLHVIMAVFLPCDDRLAKDFTGFPCLEDVPGRSICFFRHETNLELHGTKNTPTEPQQI